MYLHIWWSSMKTFIIRSTISLKILSIHLWNVQVHCINQKAFFCRCMFQMDMWKWSSPNLQHRFLFENTQSSRQETIERVAWDSLQHLINKWQWKMILLCHSIQFSIINTHPPTWGEACSNFFSLFILDHRDPWLLWYHLSRTHPRAIRYRVKKNLLEVASVPQFASLLVNEDSIFFEVDELV